MSEVFSRLTLDRSERLIVSERIQDVEPILERNKALQTIPQKSDWGRHVASIPCVIIEKWMNEEGVDLLRMSGEEFARFIRKKINDPDWRHLRTDK
jgi:hypothetical protein